MKERLSTRDATWWIDVDLRLNRGTGALGGHGGQCYFLMFVQCCTLYRQARGNCVSPRVQTKTVRSEGVGKKSETSLTDATCERRADEHAFHLVLPNAIDSNQCASSILALHQFKHM
jgi:hypothetical protein